MSGEILREAYIKKLSIHQQTDPLDALKAAHIFFTNHPDHWSIGLFYRYAYDGDATIEVSGCCLVGYMKLTKLDGEILSDFQEECGQIYLDGWLTRLNDGSKDVNEFLARLADLIDRISARRATGLRG